MLKSTPETKRIKPELPGGFRDYGPKEARMKQWILDTARRTFESFGFEPLETSAVQKTEVLTGGESDSQKIIFNVRSSQEKEPEKESDASLRFDLTVPLARFIAANPDIPKPFKRYEIGRVWRGERPQAGRYREFTQADVDIVGSAGVGADTEIAALIYTVLKDLGIENFVIKINDRKEFASLPSSTGFDEVKLWDALRTVDKKDKIGEAGVAEELEKTFGGTVAKNIMAFIAAPAGTSGALAEITQGLEAMGIPARFWEIDRAMVRGLSYYTGSIFETVLTDAPEIGSVFGGGRYDDLVSGFTGQGIPAVGASLGVDRLLAAMEKLGKNPPEKVSREALVLNLDQSLKSEYFALAAELRAAGIACSLYLGNESSFQGQLTYAVKKEIPYVLIWGSEEKKNGVVSVKNLQTRVQTEIPREKILEYFKK